jgi:acetate kinase
MNILVFNCGSSSLKYRLLSMPEGVELAGGEAQRIGPPTAQPSQIIHRVDGHEKIHILPMTDHAAAFAEVMKLLSQDPRLVPDAVGHRVVHGGSRFTGPTLVTEDVMKALRELKDLAPIHNPPAMKLMEACRQLYPRLPAVAVFDTAYHSTIPEYAHTYALPRYLTMELGLRKFGFHGTSHEYVAEEAARLLDKPMEKLNAVSCHLGSGGASLCAIVQGKSVDNTMGFSPLQGLVMSTRCGDLDPAVALQLLHQAHGDSKRVEKALNQKSGVLGLSGLSADIRDVLSHVASAPTGDDRIHQTAQVYLWRIRKYLGAYLAVVGKPDAILFTDTIGETVPAVRWAVCTGLEVFGVKLDPQLNASVSSWPCDVAAADSAVRILVVQTNEELAIARRTLAALHQTTTSYQEVVS